MSAPWLDSMPSTWREIPLQYLATVETGSRDTVDAVDDGKYPFIVRSAEPLAISTFSYDTEAILTAGDGAVGEIFHHMHGKFDAHQRVYVIRDFRGIDGRYLYWYFSSEFRRVVAYGGAQTTVASLRRSMLTAFPIAVPPLDIQGHIAGYLDRETGEIEAMIAKLDVMAEALRLRRAGEFGSILGPVFEGESSPLWAVLAPVKDQNHPHEEVLSVYRDYGVILKSSRNDNHNRTPNDLSSYQLVLPDDVVINKMKAWQGSLGVSKHRGIVSPDYQVARPLGHINPRYLHAVLRSPAMIPQYRARSIGVRPSQWRLYWDDFANLRIPLPSPDEQDRVADHLEEATGKINLMLAKVADLKALLLERRAVLITDVVTGKKDVV